MWLERLGFCHVAVYRDPVGILSPLPDWERHCQNMLRDVGDCWTSPKLFICAVIILNAVAGVSHSGRRVPRHEKPALELLWMQPGYMDANAGFLKINPTFMGGGIVPDV